MVLLASASDQASPPLALIDRIITRTDTDRVLTLPSSTLESLFLIFTTTLLLYPMYRLGN